MPEPEAFGQDPGRGAVTRCAHEGCGEAAIGFARHCWDHLPDRDFYRRELARILETDKELPGINLKKVDLGRLHIEKVNLSGANLSQANLVGAYLFDSAMRGVDLIGANLSDCDIVHCVLDGSDLTKASLRNARLWNSSLRGANLTESDLSGADLWSAGLHGVKLWHAVLEGAKSLSRENFAGESGSFDLPKVSEDGALSAEESYRNLKRYFIDNGMYNDASWASFSEKSMERRILRKKKDFAYLPSLAMNILCGYGEKPYRIVLSALLAISLFACLYAATGAVRSSVDPGYVLRWSDYLYYSTITFTTVGYGDFIPRAHAFFRLLAASEAFMGVYLTGLFIFTLARKYSAR